MAGLLAARGRLEPGEELTEQVAELPLPVGGEPGPDGRRGRRRARRDCVRGGGERWVVRWWACDVSG